MIDKYVMKLTQMTNNCEFGVNLKEHVRDHVEKCGSLVLRRKFLENGRDLTLGTLQTTERAVSQASSIKRKTRPSVSENQCKFGHHNKVSEPLFDLERGAQGHIPSQDSQPILVSHCKTLGPITREL